MKAIVLKEAGNVDNLAYVELAKPTINEGEVLIQVKAISINPVDVKSRAGKGVYGRIKTENPLILGWDISGIVEETKSSAFKVGDEVFGMVNFPGHGKAYAEYVAAPANQLALKPKNISFEDAAASTLVALTAYQALVHHANIQQGQNVLVHAASGGVGHIAIQIAKYLGAKVTGTSSPKNKDFVLSLGADSHIDYHVFDWKSAGRTFDFVLDTIGGDNIDHSLEVTKEGGSIISIPTGLNEDVTSKAESKGVKGYFILVQSSGEDMKQIASLLESGAVKPHVSKSFPFEQMRAAHLEQETGRTVGKIVITL
ncbi:NADP-dependent oxidoreductase [Sphingobacterium multivorum]|uniref:Oxidoreductase n=2 Tax=Sphingobacterium TaxID=28453 RepID=A0A420FV99_9SPHI|nr:MULTISPECIES: NADP-dependent oxidoreductase [Sphingobacterium]RKF36860.1 oxidoreductase [Sphingobacterium siyangense]RKO72158.1 NADP-dependent oxidoreductase [Sphingobacterium puteale]TWI25837.1 NADPH:quinone reductase-like Zn-dependent oxidoreductase [Sphingobacterium siyangense]